MSGLFVAIVGPSGAGKDSLIRGLAQRFADDPTFAVVRRVVTRTAGADEDHDTLDDAAFALRRQAGGFALSWVAHGLSYGVPVEIDAAMASGMIVVGNLSRSVVPQARTRWPDVLVVLVTARPETLAARLALRAREPAAHRDSRLERTAFVEPDAILDNEGDLCEAVERLYALVRSRRRRASASK